MMLGWCYDLFSGKLVAQYNDTNIHEPRHNLARPKEARAQQDDTRMAPNARNPLYPTRVAATSGANKHSLILSS